MSPVRVLLASFLASVACSAERSTVGDASCDAADSCEETDDSEGADDDDDDDDDDDESEEDDESGGGESLQPTPDLSLDDNVDPSIDLAIFTNHVGYELKGPKQAVVDSSADLETFQLVRRSDAKVVFQGELEQQPQFAAWGGGERVYAVAKFGEVEREGEFRLYVNGEYSEVFSIGEGALFEATGEMVVDFFRLSRADDGPVMSADSGVPFVGSSETSDVRGGWYDASGDLSKYLSHLNYANYLSPQQIPLTAWALAWSHDETARRTGGGRFGKAMQDEALWGADYLVRVLDADGYFYINVFDGWTGLLDEREICAFEPGLNDLGEPSNGIKTDAWSAGMREGGGMAIAALARISTWDRDGEFDARDYLDAARQAYDHLDRHNDSYLDDGRENVIDDYTGLLAATELFAATDDDDYLAAARMRADSLGDRLSPSGYFIADSGDRPFWHASDAGLPIVALARYVDLEPDADRREEARDTIATHLDYLLEVTADAVNPFGYARQHFESGGTTQSGFFIPHDNETGYWWQGENARLASLAAAALIGGQQAYAADSGRLGVPESLATFASDQLDWILGKNPLDISFFAGVGRNNPPSYCVAKDEFHGHHAGGISNGITGRHDDGTGLQWQEEGVPDEECWRQWRWVEQWLPHSTWYLVAVVAQAKL